METMDFKHSIMLTQTREAIIASSLARYYNCSLCFVQDDERRADYDFCLYSSTSGWASKVEMQDDYFITSMDQTLCLELFTFTKNGKKKGKLNYTKANKLLFIINNLKKVILLDVKVLKDFVIHLEENGLLDVYEPSDHKAWIAKHDTMPTSCALLPIKETLLADPKSCVISFDELNIPNHYDQLQLNRKTNN